MKENRTLRLTTLVLAAALAMLTHATAATAYDIPEFRMPSISVAPDRTAEIVERIIASAAKSIDISMHKIDDERIISALKTATRRGVKARIILDSHAVEPGDAKKKLESFIERSGAFLSWGNPSFKEILQDTVVVDAKAAYLFTFDLTSDALDGARGFIIRILDPRDVSEISKVFDSDWSGRRFTTMNHDLAWLPNGFSAKLYDIVRNSVQSLRIYAHSIEDDNLVRSISAASKRGVIVKVLVAEDGAKRSGPNSTELMKAGASVRIMKEPHLMANAVISDAGRANAKAFVGRIDFRARPADEVRGLAVILDDGGKVSALAKTFHSDYERAK